MPKPKKLSYQIISTSDEPELYALMEELIDEFHDHLLGAKIALAWCHSWKPDPDGILTLGKCKKAADLDRQLHDRDFIILLNHAVWTVAEFTDEQKRALLDHELCHADIALDSEGERQVTADGRTVYRIKKHDLEEFQCIVERHGCWKKHIEEFARAALQESKAPLFVQRDEPDDDGTEKGRATLTFNPGKPNEVTVDMDDKAGMKAAMTPFVERVISRAKQAS